MRYLRARRRERFVSLIAIISLAGVALGTFALTVVLSVMSGFQEDLRERLLAFNPHVTLQSSNAAAFDPAPLHERITALAGVEAAAPYVSSQVMAVSTNAAGVPAYVAGGMLRGVVAANNPVLTELKQTLMVGQPRRAGADLSGHRRRQRRQAQRAASRRDHRRLARARAGDSRGRPDRAHFAREPGRRNRRAAAAALRGRRTVSFGDVPVRFLADLRFAQGRARAAGRRSAARKRPGGAGAQPVRRAGDRRPASRGSRAAASR